MLQKKHFKDSPGSGTPQLIQKNPLFSLKDSDAAEIEIISQAYEKERIAHQQFHQAAQLTLKERRLIDDLKTQHYGRLDPEYEESRRHIREVATANKDRIKSLDWPIPVFTPDPIPDLPPRQIDHHFWWANTRYHADRGISADFLSDGLHFFGTADYRDDDLLMFSVGAIGLFELHPDRRPSSSTDRYNSSPVIELFGNIQGYTGFYAFPWYLDSKWCKCSMYLRQTIYQLGGLPREGELPWVNKSQREERHGPIDQENESCKLVTKSLPGLIQMPSVQFQKGIAHQSNFAELEVRFDIQLEGDSFIKFSPEQNSAGSVLLRFHQWEPVPA